MTLSVRVSVEDLINEMNLNCINRSCKQKYLEESDINRPGMQLMGYYEHFPVRRMQVIGNAEYSYLKSLSQGERLDTLEKFLSKDIPILCLTRNFVFETEVLELVKKYDVNLVLSELPTTKFISGIVSFINEKIAPMKTVHGVLVDVDGVGILITGDSGIGKSETALELIKRGHRLVSDDAVEIRRYDDRLVGESPELTRHLMEIRGLGLLDIRRLYGVGAVKLTKTIDFVSHLEIWNEDKYYDRIGLDEEFVDILGLKLPKISIPIKPGRNIAVILEIAARNQRLKLMGYNVPKEFNKKLVENISSNTK